MDYIIILYEGEDGTAIPKNIIREHVLKVIKEINEKGVEKGRESKHGF